MPPPPPPPPLPPPLTNLHHPSPTPPPQNLFYMFDRAGSPTTVCHIHFGMSGKFRTFTLPMEPEATPNTRLRLQAADSTIGGHVSAMTVDFGGIDLYETKKAELGPDPLRDDADPERLFERIQRPRTRTKPIGVALMDQSK